jgi:Helix-turn-helix domain/AraC-binding-like domain
MVGGCALQTISTVEQQPHERGDYWRHLVSSIHSQIDITYQQPEDFRGRALRQWPAADQIVGWRSAEERVIRTASVARRTGEDSYTLVLPVAGHLPLRQDGRSVNATGIGTIMSMASAADMWHDAAAQVFIMRISRTGMEGRLGGGRGARRRCLQRGGSAGWRSTWSGTPPRELIREERLRMVRQRLESPGYRHRTVADTCGFPSASALSTAFRTRFGTRPRDVRG